MLYRLADRLLLLKWLSYQGVPLLGHLRISNQQKKYYSTFLIRCYYLVSRNLQCLLVQFLTNFVVFSLGNF